MATYGYGVKTFVQGLALLACRMQKYLAKHDTKLRFYLPPAVYTCITGAAGCISSLCNLRNRSAS